MWYKFFLFFSITFLFSMSPSSGGGGLSYGGGVTNGQEFFIREDVNEILGSEGTYYVEDYDGVVWKPTGTIGMMSKLNPNQYKIKKVGLILNVNPMFINFVLMW